MMKMPRIPRFAIITLVLLALGWTTFPQLKGEQSLAQPSGLIAGKALLQPVTDGVVTPIPPLPALDTRRVALGERLFKEVKLSADDSVACISCHDLKHGGVDGRKVSIGVGGARGDINAPTVFNSSLNFVQFWNGRAATLEEQAAGPIQNPLEMASDWPHILPKLRADLHYPAEFARIYADGITPANILNAIATFERSLLTPDSPFDRYLRAEKVLSADEMAGYRRFRELGCAACHQGVLLGGNMYQKFGVLRDYYQNKTPTTADLGRYNVTRREEDRHVFKVPSLRNVALTAPYFHDASATTLEQAILIMGRYQLGRELAAEDVRQISAFLRSLTGQWHGKTLE